MARIDNTKGAACAAKTAPGAQTDSMAEPEAAPSTETAEPAAEAAAPAPAPAEAPAEEEPDEPEGPISILWCSGDSPGSTTQHNFEAEWKLDESEPLINERPHYNHKTPDNTMVHLFFVEHQTQSPPGRAPRWMIGPTPGNGVNGWAYADSDATSPEQIVEPWLAWLKETSSWGEARLGFKERTAAGVGNEDEDEEEEEITDGASPDGSAKKKKKKKKSKGGSPTKDKKGGKSARGKAGAGKKSARAS